MTIALYMLAFAVGYYTILLLWDFRLARRARENSEKLAALLAEFAALKSEIAALPEDDDPDPTGNHWLDWSEARRYGTCDEGTVSADCDCDTCRSYYRATDQV